MLYSQSPPLAESELLGEEISSRTRAREPDERADLRAGRQPLTAPIHPSQPFSRNDSELESNGPSKTGRIFRSLTRFSIAALIGVGVTLGWQTYGDMAKEMIAARAPTLAWWLSISTTKSPVVGTTSPDPAQQLAPLAFNLSIVRRSVEQIAAKQEEIAQSIATLQAVEEDIRQKASLTPAPAPQAAPVLQHRSPPPAGPQLSR